MDIVGMYTDIKLFAKKLNSKFDNPFISKLIELDEKDGLIWLTRNFDFKSIEDRIMLNDTFIIEHDGDWVTFTFDGMRISDYSDARELARQACKGVVEETRDFADEYVALYCEAYIEELIQKIMDNYADMSITTTTLQQYRK